MFAVLSDPSLWLMVGVVILAGAVRMLITHEPWYDLALPLFGFAAFIIGVRWVRAVEPELGAAVLLAAGGFALFVWSPKLPIPRRSRTGEERRG